AYRFDCDRIDQDPLIRQAIHGELGTVVEQWRRAYAEGSSRLYLTSEVDGATVERLAGGRHKLYRLSRAAMDVCDQFARPRNLARALPEALPGVPATPYLDPLFGSACEEAERIGADVLIDGPNPASIYRQLLVHGLLVQEAGVAVTVFCRPRTAQPAIT